MSFRRHDRLLAAHIAVWATLGLLLFLAWAQHRGFDPSLCTTYQACSWRNA